MINHIDININITIKGSEFCGILIFPTWKKMILTKVISKFFGESLKSQESLC